MQFHKKSSLVIIISSTYEDGKISHALGFLTNNAKSWWLTTKPKDTITLENFWNQAPSACLRP